MIERARQGPADYSKANYSRGLRVIVRGEPVENMTRGQLIAFIGELDAYLENLVTLERLHNPQP